MDWLSAESAVPLPSTGLEVLRPLLIEPEYCVQVVTGAAWDGSAKTPNAKVARAEKYTLDREDIFMVEFVSEP